MKQSMRISQTIIGRKLKRSATCLVIAALFLTALPLLGLFSFSYLQNSLSQMNVISGQIVQQLNLKASNIVSYSNLIPNDKLLLTLLSQKRDSRTKAQIENRLMELCGYGSGIRSVILSSDKGDFHSVFINDREMRNILASSWHRELQAQEYLRSFLLPGSTDSAFYYCANLADISSLTGSLIVSMNADDILGILENADKTFSHYVWLDSRNRPVINRRFYQERYLESQLLKDGGIRFYGESVFFNREGIFLSHYSDLARWKLVAFVPYTELLLPFLPTLLLLLSSTALIMILSSIVLRPLIHNIVAPIKILSNEMRHFSYDNVCPEKICTGDEIEELSDAFCSMSLELKKQIALLLEEQKKEQKMKYGLHISQINPHFIYNTMNTINYLARQKRSDDIIVINSALIHILKDSLRVNETSVFDTVETEVRVVEEYLKIQEYRYEEKINIIWDIDAESRRQLIPKHIIQPIVENAIIHGFLEDGFESLKGDAPFIRIGIHMLPSQGGIRILVEDNGAGIDPGRYETVCAKAHDFDVSDDYSRGKHIGLASIKWRLSYLMGKKQELTICPRHPHGTVVTITLSQI